MFINCPNLSTGAASYLLLAQNNAQSLLQFEVAHFWIYGYRVCKHTWLLRTIEKLTEVFPRVQFFARSFHTRYDLAVAPTFKASFTPQDWHRKLSEQIAAYDRWFSQTKHKNSDSYAVPTIVITESALTDGLFGSSEGNLAVISLADWRKYFSPGSALEFILSGVQRYALRLSYGSIGSHYVTRGCIWDYDVYQPDSRIAGFLGFLCSTCETALEKTLSAEDLKEVKGLLSNEWIGKLNEPTSIASILAKNYKYELRRSSGLSSSLFAAVSQSMRSEVGKFFFDVAKVALAALATLYIATHFPNWYKLLAGK